jgi:hypothetical protein
LVEAHVKKHAKLKLNQMIKKKRKRRRRQTNQKIKKQNFKGNLIKL